MRALLALPILVLFSGPVQACWHSPTAQCFTQSWQDQALAYHAAGPKVQRLYDLIDWAVIPKGDAPARMLLDGITYDDLVAHDAALRTSDGTPEVSEAERAMLMLFGLNPDAALPEVATDYLYEVYALALATGDADLATRWHQRLPDYLRQAPETPGPDGRPALLDPYQSAQAAALVALTDLQAGQVQAAATQAAQIEGEPAFLTWRALAQHAIDAGDTVLLTRAVNGLNASLVAKPMPPFAEEALKRALRSGQAELDATGDPDALVHAFEAADPSSYILPVSARITAALAQRYLQSLTGAQGDDGFDDALAAMQTALETRTDEDDATPMLNARTALRLGMQVEASRLITLVDAHFPGVAGFFIYDLPDAPTPWANDWLDLMIARFDQIIARPGQFETRDYWTLWLDQDALSTAIDITQRLAQYDRRDDAQAFADRALAYLAQLPGLYGDTSGVSLAAIFDGETAPFLYPPDVAIPRMRRLGMDETLIQYAFADAGRPVISLKLLAGLDGYRNLSHWMTLTSDVPEYLRADYIDTLRPMLSNEAARLVAQGYPDLAQTFHAEAAVFWATQGDWQTAQTHYDQITDTSGGDDPASAIRNRLVALRDIVAVLDPVAAQVQYPYEDFAL